MIKGKDKFIKNKIVIISMISILLFSITVCFATNRVVMPQEESMNMENIEIENMQKIVAPLEGEIKVTATYGKRIHPISEKIISHDGIDLKVKNGETILAVSAGVVENTGYNAKYGNFIQIKHKDFYSFYAQLSAIEVEIGEKIDVGKKIGEAGSTGMATGPHLHFEIRNLEGNTILMNI